MADFKKDFANHINVIGTNPYLFIESGLSRRYLNMPTWLNLLKDFSEKLLLQKGFGYYDSKSEGNLPELASLMASEFHETWWTNPAFSDSRKEYENKRIGSQEIPFKIELSKFVSNHKDFQEDYSEEIELLKKVVIDGIITTNWDTFLEATFSDYKTYIGQEQLLFSENISIGEIYKIHGCVTSPESLIVSSNDYANFKKRNAYLAAKLLTIFVEHPVIFLGYSISDPNILELLFSLKDCLAAHNIEKLKDRLIFVEWRAEQNEPIMIDGTLSLSDGKILPIKHIKINSFIPLFDVLANLKQRLPIKILRRFKDAVYEFVKTNEPTNKIYIGDLTNIDENGNDIEFVVGVGVANSIAKQGLLEICVDDVVEDVLFDNKHIPAKEFITDAIPKLLKKRIRIPLYKYYRAEHLLTNDGKLIKKGSAVINNYFKDKSQKSFYPSAKAYAKKENLIRTKYKTLAELIANNDKKHCFYFIPLLEQEKINIDELQLFLMQCFRNGYIKNSYFKQLVCYYDYLKFGLEQ
ncbi:SIR2 family protein [Alistipes dispar]|uniref:Uncharacterized protein n=1 Tax=Alistipes dispar TaxID=2585119 RepID=A0A4Y1X2W0_9BACT|nr:SIR2 family protein [Alistipes dispar]BBL07653.1 hypothetical protein A5CPEGH6_22910 [Alistipes dispar]